MVAWQLTIHSNDPARLVRFWAAVLGYVVQAPVVEDPDHYFVVMGDPEGYEFCVA